ncbi:MAG: hypothetical protein H7067_07710 [Burkholderiales bacterium]|nr:hypothetical protein [Opitutaceae bacterium]
MSMASPASAADITPEWIVAVANALRANGQAFRAGEARPTIEVQSINTGRFMPINLPTNGTFFDSDKTRDYTLGCIELELRTGDLARELNVS